MYSDKNIIGANIAAVQAGSVADLAGIKAGMQIVYTNGEPMRDIIDWYWLAGEFMVELEMSDGQTFVLQRHPGAAWGIEFEAVLFDGLRLCQNNCVFCFMNMLPPGMRESLYARDDDYRLSFLHGNFVTLTNLSDQDLARIVDMRLSPLHVSLQAVTPSYRSFLMGKNQGRGIEALEQLLLADIEVHAQIVLMPEQLALEELQKTLEWVEQRPGIISLGVVPYGHTRYAQTYYKEVDRISEEFAKNTINILLPFQQRAREQYGCTRFMPADEFYINAYPDDVLENLPPAAYYDGYPQYQDGIGMLRSWLDDAAAVGLYKKSDKGTFLLSLKSPQALLVTGTAFAPILQETFMDQTVLAIKNNYFGGNVDVAGLLTAQDVIQQVGEYLQQESEFTWKIILPRLMFNDDGLTLDDKSAIDIAAALNCQIIVVDCTVQSLLDVLA